MKRPEERLRDIARKFNKAPAGVVVAVDKPLQRGEVFMFVGFRFAVVEELTKDRFLERVAANRQTRIRQEREMGFQVGEIPGQGGFSGKMAAGKMYDDQFADIPSPDQKYFYAMKRV